jgi:superfamily II DNA/RNA helicase
VNGAGSFRDLGISPFFTERLLERNIAVPTEIQRRVIPRLQAGENLIFWSATGTGKTFAYLLPLFEALGKISPSLGEGRGPFILILAPTLELCSQIKTEADFLLRGFPGPGPHGGPVKVSLIIGSANMSRQIEGLKKDKPLVIVGNPARLLQLARMGKLKLQGLRFLILDEGDRLAADELIGDTGELAALVNKDRLTAACSATMSPKSRERLLPLMGGQAALEETEEREILRDRIEHWAFFSEGRRKIGTLRSFIAAADPKKVLIFTGRGGEVGNIVSQLQYHKLGAFGLYGDMNKKLRKEAIDSFRSGRARILVTSDLAARGLDIPEISHVIALDVPLGEEAYVHRAGRTARAGKRGIMATIGDGEELRRLAALEKKLGIVVYPKDLYKGKIHAPQGTD